jgi:hypothetical protein
MSDTETLDLIEHYKWSVKFIDDGCHIVLHKAGTYAFAKTIREEVKEALDKQIAWSVG